MTMPTLIFQLALGQNWNTQPATWTDFASRVKTATCRRGRPFEFDQHETGQMTVALRNEDRELEPDYAGSSYYPDLEPGATQGRLRALYDGSFYDLFRGIAQDMAPDWTLDNVTADVPMLFYDVSSVLKEADVSLELAETTSGAQITAILDEIAWTHRVIDAGISTLPATTLENANVLSTLEQIAVESELGSFHVRSDGRTIFHDRHRRLKSPYLTSEVTFGDEQPELPYRAITPVFGLPRVKNRAIVTRTGGEAQTAEDAASVTKRGRLTMTRSPSLRTDIEALDMAQYLVAKFSEPEMRFEQIEWVYRGVDADWPKILNLEISDRVTVMRRPPGGGDPIAKECHVEAIEHTLAPGNRWSTKLSLSPAAIERFMILDNSTYGKLDDSFARLGY